MFQEIISGIVQGIFEWLPVSSEGVLFLLQANFFDPSQEMMDIFKGVLFLHLGTFLAALIYLRKDVLSIFKTIINYKSGGLEEKNIFKFLFVSTLVSGLLGLLLLKFFTGFDEEIKGVGRILTLIIGLLLLVTAFLQIKTRGGGPARNALHGDAGGLKGYNDPTLKDGILLGFVQGLSVLPGLSRSGLTVSFLLLRKFGEEASLRISFLMSLPVILAANILLNLPEASLYFSKEAMAGFLFSFLFGLLTIDLLIKTSRKINFGFFVLFFGILTILSVIIF